MKQYYLYSSKTRTSYGGNTIIETSEFAAVEENGHTTASMQQTRTVASSTLQQQQKMELDSKEAINPQTTATAHAKVPASTKAVPSSTPKPSSAQNAAHSKASASTKAVPSSTSKPSTAQTKPTAPKVTQQKMDTSDDKPVVIEIPKKEKEPVLVGSSAAKQNDKQMDIDTQQPTSQQNASNSDKMEEDVPTTTAVPEPVKETTPSAKPTTTTAEKPKEETPDDYILGIDFGSQNCVVSIAKLNDERVPYVVHNSISKLVNTVAISFNGSERLFGDDAIAQEISHPRDTVVGCKQYFGKRLSDIPSSALKLEADPNTKLETAGNLLAVFDKYKLYNESETRQTKLRVEQVGGALLRKFAKYANDPLYWQDKKMLPVTNVVLSVPAVWTAAECGALLDAAAIAGLNVKHVVNDCCASSLYYAYTHNPPAPAEGEEETVNHVVIVDIGHSYTDCQLIELKHNNLKELSTVGRKIGGQDFNKALREHFIQVIQDKFTIDVKSNRRWLKRLDKAIEKAKKILSTVNDTFLEIENINDRDIRLPISRTVLENVCKNQIQQIKDVIQALWTNAGIKPQETSNLKVELVGGCVRMPIVQQVLKEACAVEELSRNIDGTCSLSMGAALFGSLFDPDSTQNFTAEFAHKNILACSICAEQRLEPTAIADMSELETKMQQSDTDTQAEKTAKDNLEQLIYKRRNELNECTDEQVPAEEKEKVLNALKEVEEWLLYTEEGEAAKTNVVREKIAAMNKTIEETSAKFAEILNAKREEKRKAAEEAKEAEKNRKVTKRDKIARPLTNKEKLEAAEKRKEQGNTLYKDLNFEHALRRYTQAIGVSKELTGELSEEDQARIDNIQIICYNNLAQCYLKLKKPKLAIENCNYALRLDSKNVKALYRKALANIEEKNWEDALATLTTAKEIDPTNKLVTKKFAFVTKKIAQQEKAEKDMYAKMFAK